MGEKKVKWKNMASLSFSLLLHFCHSLPINIEEWLKLQKIISLCRDEMEKEKYKPRGGQE